MQQVKNKLLERIRVNKDTNQIVAIQQSLKQVSDLYDIGEMYSVLQINPNFVDFSETETSAVYEKPTNAFSFYCDSVSWLPNENGFYVDMDKSGKGTSDDPWRNLTHSLSIIYCIAKQCENERMFQNTCFVLHCRGTYDYPVFCDTKGYGYRSYSCEGFSESNPRICRFYQAHQTRECTVPIYIVPWESGSVKFEIDTTKMNTSDEMIDLGFSYADLYFGYDTYLVGCDIHIVSSIQDAAIYCAGMQDGSFFYDVVDNELDFRMTGGTSRFKVPNVVRNMKFSFKNSYKSYPAIYENAVWLWDISCIENCIFDTDICYIAVRPQPLTNIESVSTFTDLTVNPEPPYHSCFLKNIKDTRSTLKLELMAFSIGYDSYDTVPYLYLREINNLYGLITRSHSVFADSLTNVVYCYLGIHERSGSYLTNSSFCILDNDSDVFDFVSNITDFYVDVSFIGVNRTPVININSIVVDNVHCKHSYMSISADVCHSCSNTGPWGASIDIKKSATGLSLHSSGYYVNRSIDISGSGEIINSSFSGVDDGDYGDSELNCTGNGELLIKNSSIKVATVLASTSVTFDSCDFTCRAVWLDTAFNSVFNLVSHLAINSKIDNCICNFEYKTDGYGPSAPDINDYFSVYENASASNCDVNISNYFGVKAYNTLTLGHAAKTSHISNVTINAQFVADPSKNNLSCSEELRVYMGGLVDAGASLGNISTNIGSLLSGDCEGVSRIGFRFCIIDSGVVQDKSTMYDKDSDGNWVRVACE